MTQTNSANSTNSTNYFLESRQDFTIIASWLRSDSKVLDLGCGDGNLLSYLRDGLAVRGYGIEKDNANWLACQENGVNVIQMDLEDGLSGFEDQSFDTVVLSQTLQAMHNTEGIIQDMLRVGREVIVTFPNFGYWRNRMQLIRGYMPVSKILPYEWHNTPNIHLCTINDFEQFCNKHNISIIERSVITNDKPVNFIPNWLGNLAMYRLKKSSKASW